MNTWKTLCASMTMAIVMSSAAAFAQTIGDQSGAATPPGPVMHSPSDIPSPSLSPPSDSSSDTRQAPSPSRGARSDCGTQPSAGINEETAPSGPQQIAGHVVALDREQGTLTLQTDSGLIRFRGSPEALQDVNVGDAIVVEYVARSQAARPNVAENGQEREAGEPSASPCTE